MAAYDIAPFWTAAAGQGTTPPTANITAADGSTIAMAATRKSGSNSERFGFTFGTGTSPTTGQLCTITFSPAFAGYAVFNGLTPFASKPTASNAATAALGLEVLDLRVLAGGNLRLQLACTTAPTASQGISTYAFDMRIST